MRIWLKRKRIECGLSQAQLAEKLGIKQYDYSRIETGSRQKKLSLETAMKLSEFLEITMEEIQLFESVNEKSA